MTSTSTSDAITPSESARQKLIGKLLLGCAMLCALAIYLPTLRFGFLMDDNHLIVANPQMESWSSIPYFFQHQLWPGVPYYRPLTLLALLTVSKLFGSQPWAFHLLDVSLYLMVVVMVYVTARTLRLSSITAGWAALLFAVHPIHLEVGAWVTGMTESLLAFSLLAALCCYIQARQQSCAWRWLFGALFFFGFALLAKELAMIFPVLLVLWELYIREKRSLAKRALQVLPFAVIAALYFLLRGAAVGTFSAVITPLPLKTKLLTIPAILLFYAGKLFAPRQTSFFYDSYYVTSPASPNFLLPLACLLLAGFIAVYASVRGWLTRMERFCILAGGLSLLPSLNFSAFVWRELAHDRYAYLASLFFALAVSSILMRQLDAGTVRRSSAIAILAVAPLLLLAVSEMQAGFYRDEFTAFVHASNIAPNNLYVVRYLISALPEHGRAQEAQMWMNHANKVLPDWWYAYQLGQIAWQHGDNIQAEMLARKAIALQSQPEIHRLLAQLLEKRGKCQEAEDEWALSYFPRPENPHCVAK